MLTVVMQGANNDYGLEPLRRCALSLNTWSKRLDPGDEIIFVDNATPEGRPPLLLAARSMLEQRTIEMTRLLVLGASEFRRLEEHFNQKCQKIVMDEIARNIAFRRSRGSWIMTSSWDVLPSVFRFRLTDLSIHRAYVGILRRLPARMWLKLPISGAERVMLAGKGSAVGRAKPRTKPWHGFGKAGDFLLCSAELYERVKGFEENMSFGWGHTDANFLRKVWLETGNGPERFAVAWTLEHGGRAPTQVPRNMFSKSVDEFRGPSMNEPGWGRYEAEEVALS